MFGSFIKFVVTVADSVDSPVAVCTIQNNSNCSLPSFIKENTKKRLSIYNELLKFFENQGLNWDDAERYGQPFITDLCHVLWYLDGHHSVLASRSCPIPKLFSIFIGFKKVVTTLAGL
jgi:hypothetical protein